MKEKKPMLTATQQNIKTALESIIADSSYENIEKQYLQLTEKEREYLKNLMKIKPYLHN
jgi:FixJ family two-component response regulator